MTGHQGRGRVRGILEVKSDLPTRASHNCLLLLACTWGFLLVANRETYTFSTTDDTLHVVLCCKINHYFPELVFIHPDCFWDVKLTSIQACPIKHIWLIAHSVSVTRHSIIDASVFIAAINAWEILHTDRMRDSSKKMGICIFGKYVFLVALKAWICWGTKPTLSIWHENSLIRKDCT